MGDITVVVRKKRDYVGKIPKRGEGGGADPNPLLDVDLPSYFWHAKTAPNQSCMPLTGICEYVGNFPKKGGGVTYSQRNCFLWGQNCDFLVKTTNVPEVLK